jgi:hypothetical protein
MSCFKSNSVEMNNDLHQTHHDQSSLSQPDETGTQSQPPTSSHANMSEVGCDVAATASDDRPGGKGDVGSRRSEDNSANALKIHNSKKYVLLFTSASALVNLE